MSSSMYYIRKPQKEIFIKVPGQVHVTYMYIHITPRCYMVSMTVAYRHIFKINLLYTVE